MPELCLNLHDYANYIINNLFEIILMHLYDHNLFDHNLLAQYDNIFCANGLSPEQARQEFVAWIILQNITIIPSTNPLL